MTTETVTAHKSFATLEAVDGISAGSNIMPVKEGMLVVFPAWLPHSVDFNKSDRERISVSFNVMFSSFGEKMSKPQWTGNVSVRPT